MVSQCITSGPQWHRPRGSGDGRLHKCVYVYWTSFNDAISNRFVLHVSDRWNHHLGCDPLESSPHSLQWGTLTKCGNSRTECTDLIWFAVVMVIQWYMFFFIETLNMTFICSHCFHVWLRFFSMAVEKCNFSRDVSLVCRWSQDSRCHGRRCQAELPDTKSKTRRKNEKSVTIRINMLQEVCTEHMKERINCWCVTCFSWTWNLLSCHVVEYYGSVNV